VTKADFIKSSDARFSAVDTNRDGFLTEAEIAAAQAKALQRAEAVQRQQLQARFKALDTNKDNQLAFAEFEAGARNLRPSETAKQALAKLDSNRDGKVSTAEYRAARLSGFDKLDVNDDSAVTRQEIKGARRN
jgi:Ca2+-binding EF-hand superfamily protein